MVTSYVAAADYTDGHRVTYKYKHFHILNINYIIINRITPCVLYTSR
jgi:hypothetical protein